jgi:DNA end-binding protein Ku
MARSIWTGALAFGLVNVPVKLFSAVEDKGVHFHQFQEGTGRRVHNKRVAEGTDDEVAYEDIVKGYEVRKGEYVMVTPDELATLDPDRSRTIDLEDVVDLDDVDPVHFDRTYYLAPANEAAAKPYALLHRALKDAGRAGIARFVMRDKQYLAAVRPTEDLLVVETMHFPDEVRDPAGIDEVGLLDGVSLSARERRMADQLLEVLSADWDPGKYKDTHREQVLELIEAKDAGEELVVEEAPERPAVTDLMAALEASVKAGRDRRSAGGKAKASSSKSSSKGSSKTSSSKGSSPSSGKGAADDRSRDELYEEATRKKVPGRSKMSKDELAAALRKAS